MGSKAFFGTILLAVVLCAGGLASPGWSQPFLLDGTLWNEISYDAKVTYIKGVGNMADFEIQADGPKTGRGYCIAFMMVQEFKDKTIDSVVKEIDQYYRENPQDLKKPVLEVMIRRASKLCPPEKTK